MIRLAAALGFFLLRAGAAHAAELDVGLALSTNFSPELPFAQRVGPRLSVGVSGLGPTAVSFGGRVGLQYDALLHRAFDLQAQAFVHRRFGLVEPSLGLGANVFLEEGRGALTYGSLGVSVRPGRVLDVFVEVSPGVLVDRFGADPWLMVGLGARTHFPVARPVAAGKPAAEP
jgi:hypothetical protein